MSLVYVVGTFVSYLDALILHTIQDFELAVFKPLFITMSKGFVEIPIFIVLGEIDWTSKHLLQSFNFRFFWVTFCL